MSHSTEELLAQIIKLSQQYVEQEAENVNIKSSDNLLKWDKAKRRLLMLVDTKVKPNITRRYFDD